MTNKFLALLVAMYIGIGIASAQTWIWYPGDYEIWLGNKMNNRRTERGAFFPPFWRQESHFVTVEFSTQVDLDAAEELTIAAEGTFNIKIDGKLQFGMPQKITIPAGQHKINIKVHNQVTPPALFVSGATIKSGSHWKVTSEDKEWIDESGKASDTSTTTYMQAGSWNFNDALSLPSQFSLVRDAQIAVSKDGNLYDFGRETFGYVKLHGIIGNGKIGVFYGESPEEARDEEHCETLDYLQVVDGMVTNLATNETVQLDNIYVFSNSKAFRYVYIKTEGSVDVANVSMDYEYMPEETAGTFRCNDELVNRMWEVGQYTLQLTTREFFIDGIKRDRGVWSGDASQSYLMNYYLFNDNEEVKRTMWLLAGKEPISSHINTIMDYTFYWLISIYDYYMYSGDAQFLAQIYPKMLSYVDYVESRTDADGLVQGLAGDWVFVDWADKPMDKHGQLSFEQILYCRALEATAKVAAVVGDTENEQKIAARAADVKAKLLPYFWDDAKKAIVHNRINGKQSDEVFKFSNIFAIMFDYLSDEQKKEVEQNVLLNDEVLKITTPYMRFYEMEALCQLGEQAQVMREMKAYWGGMLNEGATTFWEKYNPTDSGTQHLAMYGRPYGKSLCHAWGASPIYLLGRYYLGVSPTKPGYEEYEIRPSLGGLKWIEGDVPTPFGKIHIRMNKKRVTVKSDGGRGTLIVGKKQIEIPAGKEVSIRL
ncbi:MAG: alpha-rhamnosidase [Bacteroidales bacterium]|nr:alpha-rhamnosidase [Bacteroidales bacterium]